MKGWGGSAFFRRKGRGYPFVQPEDRNIDILDNFGYFHYFVAQKVSKHLQIA
jgi:hypothetical protein